MSFNLNIVSLELLDERVEEIGAKVDGLEKKFDGLEQLIRQLLGQTQTSGESVSQPTSQTAPTLPQTAPTEHLSYKTNLEGMSLPRGSVQQSAYVKQEPSRSQGQRPRDFERPNPGFARGTHGPASRPRDFDCPNPEYTRGNYGHSSHGMRATREVRSVAHYVDSGSDTDSSTELESLPSVTPAAPRNVGKVPVYDGETRWQVYLDQFREVARRGAWPESEKRAALIQHLRGDALRFYGTLGKHTRRDYKALCHAFKERFGMRSEPATARWELGRLEQGASETLELFSDRCRSLAMEGFAGESQCVIEQTAADAFLRGVRDQQAALSAGDKGPKSLGEALRLVRRSISNRSFILGDRKVRAVTFERAGSSSPPVAPAVQKETPRESPACAASEEAVCQLLTRVLSGAIRHLSCPETPPWRSWSALPAPMLLQ